MEIWLIGFALIEIAIFAMVLGFVWADDHLNLDVITEQWHKDAVIYTTIITGGGVCSIVGFLFFWWIWS